VRARPRQVLRLFDVISTFCNIGRVLPAWWLATYTVNDDEEEKAVINLTVHALHSSMIGQMNTKKLSSKVVHCYNSGQLI
jgi:hypothetical protein